MRARALDEVEEAHASVGGSGRGRGYATQQINHAYTVLLCSQFQGFCRDLHQEAVDHLVLAVPLAMQDAVEFRFIDGRKLDHGNPNPGNVGADFSRFDFNLWDNVRRLHPLNARRHRLLEEMTTWRNAIAHQDFDAAALGGKTKLHVRGVQRWRSVCDSLARSFDTVVGRQVTLLAGSQPW